MGFVDEFEAAIGGDALGEAFGLGEAVNPVNGAEGFGFFVADVNSPDWDFVAFAVGVGFGAVEEDAFPGGGRWNRGL